MNCLRSLERWDRGLESDSRLGCLPAFYSVFMLYYVQLEALRRADHAIKEFYRLCIKDYGTEEEVRAQQMGCRAVDE
jgi:hypothetical protein